MSDPSPESPSGFPEATGAVWVSHGVAALLVVVFVASVRFGGVSILQPDGLQLYGAGAMFGPALAAEGEWWRLLTTTLLHVGVLHLLVNLYAFWTAAPLTERTYGPVAFAGLYVASALGGSLASLAWRPAGLSAGASGAIFGVYGALFVYMLARRDAFTPEVVERQRKGMFAFLGYNLLFGLAIERIDMAAHAGGLVTGALAGLLFLPDPAGSWAHTLRRAGGAVGLAAGLLLAFWGVRARVGQDPTIACIVGAGDLAAQEAACTEALTADPTDGAARASRVLVRLQSDRVDEAAADCEVLATAAALPHHAWLACIAWTEAQSDWHTRLDWLDRAIAANPDDTAFLTRRAGAYGALGKDDLAEADLARSLKLAPADPTVLNDVAWRQVVSGDFEAASENVDRSLAIRPDEFNALNTRCYARVGLGRLQEGRADCVRALELGSDSPLDRAMIAFVDGRTEEARAGWSSAASEHPEWAFDLAPWLERVQPP